MAKDIDLVIRAKNEATKALDDVTKSLGALASKEAEVEKASGGAATGLGKLKTELAKSSDTNAALTAFTKIIEAFNKAKTASAGIERSLSELSGELTKTTRESQAAAFETGRLASAKAALAQIEGREKAAIAETTAALKVQTAELRQNESTLKRVIDKQISAKKLAANSDRLPAPTGNSLRDQIDASFKANLSGGSAKSSYQAIAEAQIEQSRARITATQATLTAQSANAAKTAADIATTGERLKAVGGVAKTLESDINSLTGKVVSLTGTLARSNGELAQIESTATRASAALGGLATNEAAVAARMNAEATKAAMLRGRVDGLKGGKTAEAATGSDPDALRQRRAVNVEYAAAQANVEKLSAQMRNAKGPTEDLAEAFGRAQARAIAATAAYKAQQTALQELKGATSSFSAFSQKNAQAPAPVDKSYVPPKIPDTKAAAAGASAAAAPIAAMGDAGRNAAAGLDSMGRALREVGDGSRQTLSLSERLRGEMITLAAGFIGVQAAIGGVSKVVDVFRTMEAAQNRLASVFAGDTQRVGVEIDFLQRTASRLGISFGALAGEYGKLAIAAKAQNFQSEETRRIFLAVAEAGRVNKLSNEDMSRVFLALTQMMSKGKVMSQELKTQMSEVLPGAYDIFATSIGKTTAQLEDMLAKGEVLANSDTMMAFANELNKRFGSQLQASLSSTTTQIGKFQNNLELAALQVANGGLIEGFTLLLKTLNSYLESKEGQEFFMSLGAAAGRFFTALSNLVPYVGLAKTALEAFIAVKIGTMLSGWLTGLVATRAAMAANAKEALSQAGSVGVLAGSQTRLNVTTNLLHGSLGALRARMLEVAAGGGAMAAGSGIAAAGLGILQRVALLASVAVRGLLAAFGGVAGLVLTGVTVAVGYWLTKVEDTTAAIADHKKLMDQIVGAYDKAADKAGDWQKNVEGLTKAQIEQRLNAAIKETTALTASKQDIVSPTIRGEKNGMPFVGQDPQINLIVKAFKEGTISAAEFKKSLDDLGNANPNLKSYTTDLQNQADKYLVLEAEVEKLKAQLALMNGTATEAQKRLLGTADALKQNDFKAATADVVKFKEAIDGLKAVLPALAVELKKTKFDADALENLRKAVEAANGDEKLIKEAYALYDRAGNQGDKEKMQAYLDRYSGGKIPASMFQAIKGEESYRSSAYDIGDGPTIGFGSKRMNGRAVQMGDTVTEEQAYAQATKDIQDFLAKVLAAVGDRPLNQNQLNALTSYVYNTGNTNNKAFRTIREGGSDQEVADALRNGINTQNGKVLPALTARRGREADLFMTPVDRSTGDATGKTELEIAQQKEEARIKRLRESEEETRKDNQAADAQRAINDAESEASEKRKQAIAKLRLDEEQKYHDAGTPIDTAAVDARVAAGTKLYDANHVTDQAKEQEAKANALYAERLALMERIKVAKEQGDTEMLTKTRAELEDVNKKTREAIDLAIKYWEAVGGPEADKAIAKLRKQTEESKRAEKGILTAGRVNNMLADGIANAFDTALSGIGKAIAGTEKWSDAIKGVGVAFVNFAATFIREIAMMILKQMVLNALQSAMGGGAGGAGGAIASIANSLVGTGHTGGLVGSQTIGSGNASRSVSPLLFANAARYHNGGIPGLQPNEVPAILKKNEEVLTENDPRNMLNGGKNGGGATGAGFDTLKVINVLKDEHIADAMQSPAGTKAVLSVANKNRTAFKSALGMDK